MIYTKTYTVVYIHVFFDIKLVCCLGIVWTRGHQADTVLVYNMVYIMLYSMVYIMLSGMVYIMLYGMVYTKSYLNSLLNRHSWNIARCWYRKITQQCSDICSFKSRQAVTKFSQGIPPSSTLSAACTARQRCIIVVFPVLRAPIRHIV